MDRFENIASVGSSMKGPDALVDKRYKNASNLARWITIQRSECVAPD